MKIIFGLFWVRTTTKSIQFINKPVFLWSGLLFLEKFKNSGVLKAAYGYDNKTFGIQLFKILRFSTKILKKKKS
jgi:hypothetical protein